MPVLLTQVAKKIRINASCFMNVYCKIHTLIPIWWVRVILLRPLSYSAFCKIYGMYQKIHINCPQCCPSIRIEMSPGKISLVDIQVVEINLSKTMWGYYLRSDLLVALAYESFHTYPQNFNTEYVSKTQGCSQRHPIGFAELLVHKCDLKRSDIFYFTLL